MPMLFTYGTLQSNSTQMAIIGREVPLLEPATLNGYGHIGGDWEGRGEIPMISPASGAVTGSVFHVTDYELECTDRYEGRGYRRIRETVKIDGKDLNVFVYVHNP